MSKLVKFFITCAAVCVLGIVMTFAGYAAGGVEGLEKVESSHSWFNVGSMNSETDMLEVGEYEAIKVDGGMDIAIVGPNFTDAMNTDLEEAWIEDAVDENFAGKVLVKWKEGTESPEIQVTEGVLTIHNQSEGVHGEVNLSTEDSAPDIIVFCEAKILKGMDINLDYGDISIGGIACDNLQVNVDCGDVEMNGVDGTMMLKIGSGDIEFTDCKGSITADVETGDIEFDTAMGIDQFEVALHTDTGDVQVNDAENEVKDFNAKGGPNKLTLSTGAGDIEADFFGDAVEQ